MNSPGFTRPSLNCKLEECQKDFLLFQARTAVEWPLANGTGASFRSC